MRMVDCTSIHNTITLYNNKQTLCVYPAGWNACGFNNSDCQHLCLSLPNKTNQWNFRCECPTHYELNDDGKTCKGKHTNLAFIMALCPSCVMVHLHISDGNLCGCVYIAHFIYYLWRFVCMYGEQYVTLCESMAYYAMIVTKKTYFVSFVAIM